MCSRRMSLASSRSPRRARRTQRRSGRRTVSSTRTLRRRSSSIAFGPSRRTSAPVSATCSSGGPRWGRTARSSRSRCSPPAAAAWRTRRTSVAAVSPARRAAYEVLLRVFEQEAYADRAFRSAAEGLDERERAFAQRLAYGSVQRVRTLDHAIETLGRRPVRKLDPPVRAALRLGAYQLGWTETAPHAAVNESVELVRRARLERVVRLVDGDLPAGAETTDIPGAYRVERVDENLVASGRIWPQSRGSQLAGLCVGSQPGERLLDLCAAPG